jgi:hypothetical protein
MERLSEEGDDWAGLAAVLTIFLVASEYPDTLDRVSALRARPRKALPLMVGPLDVHHHEVPADIGRERIDLPAAPIHVRRIIVEMTTVVRFCVSYSVEAIHVPA